jgi:hypothetical protein
MELHDDFGVELSNDNLDRLFTGLSLLTSNSFFVSPPDFCRACIVMSSHAPMRDEMATPDTKELAWGITEGMLIAAPDEKDPFCPEILGLIGDTVNDEGILNPPDTLRIGTRDKSLVDNVQYSYSDDPEMFSSIYQLEAEKTADINWFVKDRSTKLFQELLLLPLQHGKREVAERILASLSKTMLAGA